MLTEQQIDWLNKLSDTDKVKIVPYNPKITQIFKKQQAELQSILGLDAVVLHQGASAWGISGKGDVDIFIPVGSNNFGIYFEKMKLTLGEPGSRDNERIRWNRQVEDIKVEIFLVNQDMDSYRDNITFWDYIETHPDVLEEYRKIKEEAEGTSTREYYTRKVNFINSILQSIKGAK